MDFFPDNWGEWSAAAATLAAAIGALVFAVRRVGTAMKFFVALAEATPVLLHIAQNFADGTGVSSLPTIVSKQADTMEHIGECLGRLDAKLDRIDSSVSVVSSKQERLERYMHERTHKLYNRLTALQLAVTTAFPDMRIPEPPELDEMWEEKT